MLRGGTLKPLFPEQAPTSNLSTPFKVGPHLGFDHGDSAQGQGPLCGGISNVIGCCEKNTTRVFASFAQGWDRRRRRSLLPWASAFQARTAPLLILRMMSVPSPSRHGQPIKVEVLHQMKQRDTVALAQLGLFLAEAWYTLSVESLARSCRLCKLWSVT
jgi:hypothetical protein